MIEEITKDKVVHIKVGEKCKCDVCGKFIYEIKYDEEAYCEESIEFGSYYWKAIIRKKEKQEAPLDNTEICPVVLSYDFPIVASYDLCSNDCLDTFTKNFENSDDSYYGNLLVIERK